MREYSAHRRPRGIIEWKRTGGQYVAILEPLDQFEARSIHELQKRGPETVLAGKLKQTGDEEWYALAYSRFDLEFEEARAMAQATLERLRATERT